MTLFQVRSREHFHIHLPINFINGLSMNQLFVKASKYKAGYSVTLFHNGKFKQCHTQSWDNNTETSSALLASCEGIHQSLVDSPHRGPAMQKVFPCYDVIMVTLGHNSTASPRYTTSYLYASMHRKTASKQKSHWLTQERMVYATHTKLHQLIEAKTRWLSFYRQHFQMHYLE